MTIGDTINLFNYEPQHYASIRAEVAEGRQLSLSAEELWSKPNLVLTGFDHMASMGSRKLFRRRSRPNVKSGARTHGATVSLESLLEEYHAVSVVDAGDGPEPLGVPFSHVFILTGENLHAATGLAEQQLTRLIDDEFKNMIDPDWGIRARFMAGRHHSEDAMSVYFGYGIFVPSRQDEKPVGQLSIVRAGEDQSSAFEPMLPDDSVAAFYRGQTGLAFAADESLAPATSERLPSDVLFYLGRYPGDEYEKRAAPLYFNAVSTAEDTYGRPLGIQHSAPGEDLGEWEGYYDVADRGEELMRLYYSFDSRVSRLRRFPPKEPHLSIVGLSPPAALPQSIYRWWVDLMADDHLAHSALCRRKKSLVIRDKSLRSYDWTNYAYESGRRSTGLVAMEQIEVDGEMFPALVSPVDMGSFGYLKLPQDPAIMTFDDEGGSAKAYEMDWLNHACSVEFSDTTTAGLATALGNDLAFEIIAHRGQVEFRSRAGQLFQEQGERNRFERVNHAVIETGGRVMAGPLVLHYSHG